MAYPLSGGFKLAYRLTGGSKLAYRLTGGFKLTYRLTGAFKLAYRLSGGFKLAYQLSEGFKLAYRLTGGEELGICIVIPKKILRASNFHSITFDEYFCQLFMSLYNFIIPKKQLFSNIVYQMELIIFFV